MIHIGDCLKILPTMEENSIDAVVTDPPYELGFMGKGWDKAGVSFDPATWSAILRVAKPGAHLLAFGGTRTFHRIACAIEDAGWEIRDTVMWVYGSGFPKSLDVSKAIDKAAGAVREVVGRYQPPNGTTWNLKNDLAKRNQNAFGEDVARSERMNITAPATDDARQWEGWGTALKPAWEPIIVARKPLIGSVVENVLKYGTGGLNIDGTRIDCMKRDPGFINGRPGSKTFGQISHGDDGICDNKGRWPANLIHDGSDEVVGLFPDNAGRIVGGGYKPISAKFSGKYNNGKIYEGDKRASSAPLDTPSSAARFFYCAKSTKKDRDQGCNGMEERKAAAMNNRCVNCGHGKLDGRRIGPCCENPKYENAPPMPGNRNHHPTVKPLALMMYLCRLVTPPGGVILDPFMGSGSTGKAAEIEGFRFIGIELNPEYVTIGEARIDSAVLPLFRDVCQKGETP